jgi:pimeloyl-ACP methyl ester carboxylesterase
MQKGTHIQPISTHFLSQGAQICASFYPAEQAENPPTLLFVPGWPADPEDFLGLGLRLSHKGINHFEFCPRGHQESEGFYTHSGALQDIGAALAWLHQPQVAKKYHVDTEKLALGGFSNGGGLAMAYAASDTSVRYVVSCACNDFGQFGRDVSQHRMVARNVRMEAVLDYLWSTQAPLGPARFDPQACLEELIDHPEVFGLRENAARLADRSILMFGGWEDEGPNIENYQLPLYRTLKAAGAKDVTFIVYHTTHNFSNVRQRLASDIARWIHRNFEDHAPI